MCDPRAGGQTQLLALSLLKAMQSICTLYHTIGLAHVSSKILLHYW